jgi:hypothetical protein
MGYIAVYFGPLTGMAVAATCAMSVAIVVAISTGLWQVDINFGPSSGQ